MLGWNYLFQRGYGKVFLHVKSEFRFLNGLNCLSLFHMVLLTGKIF